MAFSRHLRVVGICGVAWLVAIGCDDDGDRVAHFSSAGAAGESPNGGKSSGGSSNSAGSAGNATAGKGGNESGGNANAGTAGHGGSAGAPSTMGGAGGEGGALVVEAMGGAGGAAAGAGGVSEVAGTGGAGGEGGEGKTPLVSKQCAYQCDVDANCIVGVDHSKTCDPVTKRCVNPGALCSSHGDCVPFASGLAIACLSDAACDPLFEVCVSVSGRGWCALKTDPDFGCAFSGGSPTTADRVGAAGTAEVCLKDTGRCDAGTCIRGCADPDGAGCSSGTGATCDAATGLCECALSTECTANGVSVCGAASHCGCSGPTDCSKAGVAGQNACVAGTCGCGAPADCPNPGYASVIVRCE